MIELNTKRLKLRAWAADDMDALIEGLDNYNISKWMAYVPFPYTREDAMKWMNYCKKIEADKINAYEFAIELISKKK